LPTDVRLDGPAQKQFEDAPTSVQAALRVRAADLAQDPQAGEYVPILKVPSKLTVKKWTARVGRLTNLYKVELPSGWRALYTVGSRGPERVVLILEVVDHKKYERLMGYG